MTWKTPGLAPAREPALRSGTSTACAKQQFRPSLKPASGTPIDLQAFNGHRDVRMLLRYAHLYASRLAKLDNAFRDGPAYKGRRRTVVGRISFMEPPAAQTRPRRQSLRRLCPSQRMPMLRPASYDHVVHRREAHGVASG